MHTVKMLLCFVDDLARQGGFFAMATTPPPLSRGQPPVLPLNVVTTQSQIKMEKCLFVKQVVELPEALTEDVSHFASIQLSMQLESKLKYWGEKMLTTSSCGGFGTNYWLLHPPFGNLLKSICFQVDAQILRSYRLRM